MHKVKQNQKFIETLIEIGYLMIKTHLIIFLFFNML